jgi:hypothetical protein
MFDGVARMLLVHQHEYEDIENEVYGYLDTSRAGDKFAPEFVIKGFGKEPVPDCSIAIAPKEVVQKPELDSTENFTTAVRIPAQCSTWDEYHQLRWAAEDQISELGAKIGAKLAETAKTIPPSPDDFTDTPF